MEERQNFFVCSKIPLRVEEDTHMYICTDCNVFYCAATQNNSCNFRRRSLIIFFLSYNFQFAAQKIRDKSSSNICVLSRIS
jgi:hypothetical protein